MTNSSKKRHLPQSKRFRFFVLVTSFSLSTIVTLVSAYKLNSETIVQLAEHQITFNFDAIILGISLLLGCSTFIIIELIVLVIKSVDFFDQKAEYDEFMENINEYSAKLHEINNYYYGISMESHGSNDLFVTYAKKEIEKLNDTLRVAAKQKEIGVSYDYILNVNGVFDAFSTSKEKILKMTFPIHDTDDTIFISSAEARFFEVLQKEVMNGTLYLVQVIVILEKKSILQKDCVKKLLDFFAAEEKYECKLCLIDSFRNVCNANGVPSQFVDFGIYGDKMLFVAEQYTPTTYKGTYYKNIDKIKSYTKLFDEVWNSNILAEQNENTNSTKIKIVDLIKYETILENPTDE